MLFMLSFSAWGKRLSGKGRVGGDASVIPSPGTKGHSCQQLCPAQHLVLFKSKERHIQGRARRCPEQSPVVWP